MEHVSRYVPIELADSLCLLLTTWGRYTKSTMYSVDILRHEQRAGLRSPSCTRVRLTQNECVRSLKNERTVTLPWSRVHSPLPEEQQLSVLSSTLPLTLIIMSRIWLITGASSGFGLELARIAAHQGDRVLAASRTPEKLGSLVSSDKVKPVYLDHNKPLPEIQTAVKDILAIHGTVDLVVNNAAYVQTGMLEEVSPDDTLRQFQANTLGPLNLYRALLPHFREKGTGAFITIGSMAAWYPMPGCNLYNASKAALRWIAIGLAGEISQFGIKHCLVEPGFFRTELLNPSANISGTNQSSRLPAYKELNSTTDANFAAFHGAQLGDPVKGAQVIYDVVTSSGAATGRSLPELLPLGSDASEEISKSASKTLASVEEFKDISALSDIPKA